LENAAKHNLTAAKKEISLNVIKGVMKNSGC